MFTIKAAEVKEAFDNLADAVNKAGVKIAFGLEAQGHIPTIEAIIERWNNVKIDTYPDEKVNMIYSKHVWEEIGRTIGWDSFTACLYYFEYLENKNKS